MAALSIAIEQARRKTATRENRESHKRAALRLEELIKVEGIADQYDEIDRAGDLAMETWFAQAYQSMPTDELRDLITAGFLCWQRTERAEEELVHGDVEAAGRFMRGHNPVWVEGQPVPDEWLSEAAEA